jgi:hypothetical protein
MSLIIGKFQQIFIRNTRRQALQLEGSYSLLLNCSHLGQSQINQYSRMANQGGTPFKDRAKAKPQAQDVFSKTNTHDRAKSKRTSALALTQPTFEQWWED